MTTTLHTNHRLLGCAGLALVLVTPSVAQEAAEGNLDTIQITGLVRYFKPVGTQGGHVDFENTPENGRARPAATLPDGPPRYFANLCISSRPPPNW